MTPPTDRTAGFPPVEVLTSMAVIGVVMTAVTTFFVRSIGSNPDRLRINVNSTIGQSEKGASRNLTTDLSYVEA
jgi:hypothetical protein